MAAWVRRWRRRLGSLLLLVALLAILALFRSPERLVTADGERVHVIDGDSLRIGGRIVRLADMDAVELRQYCSAPDETQWSCGLEARAALDNLVRRGELTCRSRTSDAYGRAVARCAVEGMPDVAATLVAQGWAVSGDARRRGSMPSRSSKHARRSWVSGAARSSRRRNGARRIRVRRNHEPVSSYRL